MTSVRSLLEEVENDEESEEFEIMDINHNSEKLSCSLRLICIKSLNPTQHNIFWCQNWDFMPITREIDEQLKTLSKSINALKRGQKESKERMRKVNKKCRKRSKRNAEKPRRD
ncbi:hypothetical protein TNCV_2500951 [Trichonephila clavipes]|nr:hypothetical protein TNCV_2500951 [Trichonephila clavipes]